MKNTLKHVSLVGAAIVLVLGICLAVATRPESQIVASRTPISKLASHDTSELAAKPALAESVVRSRVNQSKPPSPILRSSVPAQPEATEEPNLEDQSREMHALVEQQMAHPSGDSARDVSEQFELLVTTALGKDFPQDRLEKVMDVQHEIFQEGSRVDEALIAGDITQDEAISANAAVFRKAAQRFSSVLTRDEYVRLFGMEPTDDPAGILIPPPG